MIVLETERLTLRHFRHTDGKALACVFADPEVMRFGDGIKSIEWIQDWIKGCLGDYQRWGWGPFAAIENASGDLIGYCGLFHIPDVNGRPEIEIGYRLARESWGQGYATEAVLAVRDWAFGSLGLTRLVAMIDPENTASIRVAQKAGMTYEQDVTFEGYTHPDRVYAVSRVDTVRFTGHDPSGGDNMSNAGQLTAVIEREGSGYVATCPEFDVVSQGDTVEEARMNLVEAVEGFFEVASSTEVQHRRTREA